jgi:hypothetical protein
MTQLTFEEATITIATKRLDTGLSSQKTVSGKIAVGTKLAYCEDTVEGSGLYVVSHLTTGYRFPPAFRDEETAQEFIGLVAPMVNWDQGLKELSADPAYRRMVEAVMKWMKNRCRECGRSTEGSPLEDWNICRECNPW